MGTSNLILSSLFLASSLATHYNLQALDDVSASAEIVGRASEIIPMIALVGPQNTTIWKSILKKKMQLFQ